MKISVFLLLIFGILSCFSLSCLKYSTSFCQNCAYTHYESSYPSNLKLSFSKFQSLSASDCLLKNANFSLKRTILVTNSLCTNENLTYYDQCYEDFLIALQQESIKQADFLSGSLIFKLKPGNHSIDRMLLITSEEELFRRSLFNISISCESQNEKVNVFIRTNEFYFFVSGELSIEGIDFQGKDIEIISNSSENCYNQKQEFCCFKNEKNECDLQNKFSIYSEKYMISKKYYGLFNLEYMLDDDKKRVPKLYIKNCSFQNFQAINVIKGWNTLISLAPFTGIAYIINTIITDSYFPKSLFYYSFYAFDIISPSIINCMKENNDKGVEQSFFISNITIKNYNKFNIDNEQIGGFPLINFQGFEGKIYISNCYFESLRKAKHIFFLKNIKDFIVENLKFYYLRETDIFYISSINNLSISNLYVNDCDSKFLTLENSYAIVDLKSLKILNFMIKFGDFITISQANVVFRDCFMENGIVLNDMISTSKSEINVLNSSFYLISCQRNLFYFTNANTAKFNDSILQNVSQCNSLIFVSSIKSVYLTNFLIKKCYSYNIFVLINILLNQNKRLFLISNKLNNVWSNDHSCIITFTSESMFAQNLIAFKIIFIRIIFLKYSFIAESFYLLDNNSTSLSMISMTGFMNFSSAIVKNNYFLDANEYLYMFDLMNTELYMENCYMEDNGVIEKKTFYLTKDGNIVVSLWTMNYSYFSNCVFIVSKLIDLVSGFICAMPLAGDFYLLNSSFIMVSHNENFGYKAILLDHFKKAQLINNSFNNLACNEQDFYHSHGGVILTAGSSLSYKKNDFYAYMKNNVFFNCMCLYAGGLAIISISNIYLENLKFFNSTTQFYGGNFIIAGAEQLTMNEVYLNLSKSDEGAGFLLQNIQKATIKNMFLINSFSRKNGILFCKNVIDLEIENIEANNLYTKMNGGFLYLFQSTAKITNAIIHSTIADFRGGCIFLHGSSSLVFENSFVYETAAFIGGTLSVDNAKEILISDLKIVGSFAQDKGAGIFLDVLSNFTIENTSLENCSTQKNGIIFINTQDEYSNIDFKNIICSCNTAKEGSCLYYLSASRLTIENLHINANGPLSIYIFWPFEINVTFINLSITNSFNEYYFLMSISGVNLQIDGGFIFNNSADKGNLILLQSMTGTFKNLIFLNNECIYIIKSFCSILNFQSFYVSNDETKKIDSSIIESENTFIYIKGIIISSCFSNLDAFFSLNNGNFLFVEGFFINNSGQILKVSAGNLNITKSKFYLNHAYDSQSPNEINYNNDGNQIYKININDSVFYVSKGYSIKSLGSLDFVFRCSHFISNSTINLLNAFILTDCKEIQIINCTFQNFSYGTISFFSNDYSKYSILKINHSVFSNNSGELGSAIYLSGNFKAHLFGNIFVSNRAIFSNYTSNKIKGIAPCLYFQYADEKLSEIFIEFCEFTHNIAFFLAPTIFSEIPIKASNNFFFNNRDSFNFTQELAAFPFYFKLKNETNGTIEIISGKEFELSLIITDYFGNKIAFENETVAVLKPTMLATKTSPEIALQNELSVAIMGEINYKKLIIKTNPGTNFSLNITANFLGFGNIEFSIHKTLNFYARSCILGEVLLADKSCYLCPEKTYYLNDPMDLKNSKYQKCYECPENCRCFGGIYLTPMSGYYRRSNKSISVVPCFNENACLGVNFIPSNYNDSFIHGFCKEGNYGKLCFYCLEGFGKFDKRDYCTSCTDTKFYVYLRLVIYLFIMIVYVLLNCHFAENCYPEKENNYKNARTFFKILVNHSQHITIIISTAGELPFPSLGLFFRISDYFAFANEYTFTNDCLLQTIYKDPITIILFKGIFNTILPLVFAIGAFLVWVILKWFFSNSRKCFDSCKAFFLKILLFIVISIFVFYSLIVKSCFGLFACLSLDKEETKVTYLKESPELTCWEFPHLNYILIFGIPGLIIWGVIFPIFLYLTLRKYSKTLKRAEKVLAESEMINELSAAKKEILKNVMSNIEQSKIFVFFYKDYYGKYFYWECIIFLRKFILTFLASMIETIPFEIDLMLMEIVIVLSSYYTYIKFPYKLKNANLIEMNSLVTCGVTIFFTNTLNSKSGENIKYFTAVFCIIINLQFFVVVLFMGIIDVAQKTREKKKRLKKKPLPMTFGKIIKQFRIN